ncbi:peptidylglycine alpha-hydroxylating monooxygenase-like [Saccostrea cucullata]|uniref:peptidylglycine alpha-hydroxylating monooxygenase-like n=1 Tax=Saccostrea cuccullata TaxID=36930 RepID=UPI002ED6B5A1
MVLLLTKRILIIILGTCLLLPRCELKYIKDPNFFTKSIRMPNVKPQHADDLICHGVKLDEREAYILKYEPHASKEIAHHMMVYGCGEPGSTEDSWACGEMDDRSDDSVCKDGQREIVYAWAMDADSRELPEGVGFRVSGNTSIKYLVIQLHYKGVLETSERDDSGVTLHMTYTRQPQQAGFYVLGNFGYIPPMIQNFHLESACKYNNYTINPIGFRTHSHNLGVVTSAYRIRHDKWTEIGRMSPQLPQAFYDVYSPGMDIRQGDVLAARCTMSSDRTFPTKIGSTNKDEMCNFYILYSTDNPANLEVQYCFRDAQTFRWGDYLASVPVNASSTVGLPEFTREDPFA